MTSNQNHTYTSLLTRISYAFPDIGGQLIFCVISFYLLKFYTDVYGLSAATAATILLVARLVDAVDAPLWGIIFDKTHSRWGKSRPWFLWLCVPFAMFGVLTFFTPNLSHTGKVLYAAGTYIACSVLYTGINTPVTSILSALTPNSRERVTLTCFRMFGSKIGVLLVNLTAFRLVAWFGQGDDQKGFKIVLPMYAVCCVVMFLLAFRNLAEIVPQERKRQSIMGNFGAIKGNYPWLIIFSSCFCFWVAFNAAIAMLPFFFQYVMHREKLVPLANSLDFISLATVLLLPYLCRVTSKRNVWLAGMLGMLVGEAILFFGASHGSPVAIIMVGWGCYFLFSGMAMALPFSMLSDTVDYGEWKTGIRAPGVLTAIGTAFCVKAGSGLGGALPGWTISAFGYVPNVEQTPQSLKGITIAFIGIPALFLVLSMIPAWFYKKYELLEPQIAEELTKRRALAAKETSSLAIPAAEPSK